MGGFWSPRGSAPAKARPAVILQGQWLLRSRIETVIVVPLTSNLQRRHYPGNVLIPREASGLELDSVAIGTQLTTVGREFVQPFPAGSLPTDLLESVSGAVRKVLDL